MTESTSPEQTPLQQAPATPSTTSDIQTVDPCHLYTDCIDDKADQLDKLIQEIGDLLQQLELCRRNGPGGANWLAGGSDAVHNAKRQLTLAATNARAVYMTMRRPQQQAVTE